MKTKFKSIFSVLVILILVSILLIVAIPMLQTEAIESEAESKMPENISYDEYISHMEKNTKNYSLFLEAKKESADVVGWIEVENTKINSPIVQHDDNDYYKNNNWKGEEDENGACFADVKNRLSDSYSLTPNIVLYGKNTDSVFGELSNYTDKDFYLNHKNIYITISDVLLSFEVVSVGKENIEDNAIAINPQLNSEEIEQVFKLAQKRNIHETEEDGEYRQMLTLVVLNENNNECLIIFGAVKQ